MSQKELFSLGKIIDFANRAAKSLSIVNSPTCPPLFKLREKKIYVILVEALQIAQP